MAPARVSAHHSFVFEAGRRVPMTPEAWTVIGTGIVILIAIAASNRQHRRDMNELRRELGGKIEAVRKELRGEFRGEIGALRQELGGEIGTLRGEIQGLRGDINGFRERMARLEGLMDGLHERVARIEGLVDGLREALIGAESAREFHGTTRDAG
jgi:chromosome segregation ATPase